MARPRTAKKGKRRTGTSRRGRKRRRKLVYSFGGGRAQGRAAMRDLLGGKGANLAEMAGLGLPVPPGFTITTEVCTYFSTHNGRYPPALSAQVRTGLERMGKIVGRRFGDHERPLLVSVRSGARASMPGMMDTVLNLGLNDASVEELARQSGNPRFAYDAYRRFVQMYGDVVLGLKPERPTDPDPFEGILEKVKSARGITHDTGLDAEALRTVVLAFKKLIQERTGRELPSDPEEQLWGAIGAVFRSWNNPRAITYRQLHRIPETWGTAVNVQAMVFGNLGDDCATGVAFSRDPSTGERRLYGEFLQNAQGEDVVAGTRTPLPLEDDRRSLAQLMPQRHRELVRISRTLERHYRDLQDMEFTIERGRLWMLQTRSAQRTAAAAVKTAVDMAREGLISQRTAVLRVPPAALDQLLHPTLDPRAQKQLLARGLPASPGAAAGEVVFSADAAVAAAREGRQVILVRAETSADDIHGMHAAGGILTARGGMTSHAAVVARGMGKCCVVGCGDVTIDAQAGEMRIGEDTVREGEAITLDGSEGAVYRGHVPTMDPRMSEEFDLLLRLADRFRRLRVRANADTPQDAQTARRLGAEGIGLCRTEHMFFASERIGTMQAMILAENAEERQRALDQLEPMQKADFVGIFRAMAGYPVTVRLLDPPLHEFLPQTDHDLAELAARIGIPPEQLRAKRDALAEQNPMLGHRGCRLGITFPEIYRMQVRAIMNAAAQLTAEAVKVIPEIMIPLVGDVAELGLLRRDVLAVCDEVQEHTGTSVHYSVGTMIELPRAALTADAIAREADFFSFGTNDLTQMTSGLSRDDAGKFLPTYVERRIFPEDPFVSLDQQGVGELVRMGVERGRRAHPKLKVGICGEHGGDPASVIFFHRAGLDYVSCSPYRIPLARLAAAQAALGPEEVER